MAWWFKKDQKKENNRSESPENSSTLKEGFFDRLKKGLQKTRDNLVGRIDQIFKGRKTIDEELLEELEEILITSDVSVEATRDIIKNLNERVIKGNIKDPTVLYELLEDEISWMVDVDSPPLDIDRANPLVVMVIGVNGVGKTTTIAKLSYLWKNAGKNPLLAAGDTFRAAAIEQLTMWAERVPVPIVKQKPGADPSAVVYDALEAALSRKNDMLIVDTAGRMHTKSNLMEELKKIRRVLSKKIPEAPHETFLVLDATVGQNAYSQVKIFKDAMDITGLVLTKLDGTAKGGVVLGLCHEFNIPVRFIGVGEGMEDLRPFNPKMFAKAMIGSS